jgi:hypothetical protein
MTRKELTMESNLNTNARAAWILGAALCVIVTLPQLGFAQQLSTAKSTVAPRLVKPFTVMTTPQSAAWKAALNPQPIPPGHSLATGPSQKSGYAALNPQPIPPGHSAIVGPTSKSGYGALNPQPIPPGFGNAPH